MNIETYKLISDHIAINGPISFDLFMELALYSDEGYYSGKNKIGITGDYYTSPTLHPIFSAFISTQINYLWEYLGKPYPFNVVELGCGSGVLSKDIVSSFDSVNNGIQDALRYIAVDRISPNLTLDKVEFIQSDCPPRVGGVGIVVANELFDAFPVKRFEIISGVPQEILVGMSEQDELIEIISPDTFTPSVIEYIVKFDLPEGYRGVVNSNFSQYFESLSKTLDKGFFITFDYGYEEQDYYSKNRSNKHIQTYFKHIDGLRILDNVGEQDITSHVNFTSVINSGAKHGFESVILKSQSDWLKDMNFYEVLRKKDFSIRETQLINSLIDPDELGKFIISIQQKNVGSVNYLNLIPSLGFMLDNFHVPPIHESHLAYQLNPQGFYGI